MKRGRLKRKTFGIRKASRAHFLKARRYVSSPKDRIWGLKRADTEFRAFMLKSVPAQCVFPNCQITDPKKLTVSHYFGRVNKGTRFDMRNCDFLCRNHHYWDKQLGWEFQKQTQDKHGWDGRYTLYMREKLAGQWFVVKALAESDMKQKAAIIEFQTLYG